MNVQICKQCFLPKPVNAKGICPECTFKNNHNGKSQQEVYSERAKAKQGCMVGKIYVPKLPVFKKAKTSPKLKNERLAKRQAVIDLDEVTYEEVFNKMPHECEECGIPLPDVFRDENDNVIYRAQYSHILSKAAYPEFRHNWKNFNRLCITDHTKWETGERTEMKIFAPNQTVIQGLLNCKNFKSL